jgi:hypothetical protein
MEAAARLVTRSNHRYCHARRSSLGVPTGGETNAGVREFRQIAKTFIELAVVMRLPGRDPKQTK